jgi:hypothetical protein
MKEVTQLAVTTPDGRSGPWSISTFTLSAEDARRYNFTALQKGRGYLHIEPGTYRRLTHDERGVVMSNTPMEIRTNMEFIERATGNVLINGLGLGMVLEAVLRKPDVKHVVVVEMDSDVIALTAPHFQADQDSGRLRIVCQDCYTYIPNPDSKFDAVWHDVWDNISDGNLPYMDALAKKYANVAKWQGFWAIKECEEMKREFEQMCLAAGKTYEGFLAYMELQGVGL